MHETFLILLLRLAGLVLLVIATILFAVKRGPARRSAVMGVAVPGIALELILVVLALGRWGAVMVQAVLLAAFVVLLMLAGGGSGNASE